MEIPIDKPTIKALANDSRVKILKELRRRRFTQSELAQNLSLAVPTVKEHLGSLEKAELVAMHDEGRKWKYYSLTRKAKHIFEPERVNLLIVLGTFILSVAGGVYVSLSNFAAMSGVQMERMPMAELAPMAEDAAATASFNEVATIPVKASIEPAFWQTPLFWSSLVVVSFALLCLVLYKRFKTKKLLGKYLNKK